MKLSEGATSRLRRVISTVTSVLTLTVGVLFIAACCYLNGLGQSPFTYENIASVFAAIAVPVFVTLAVIVIGFIFNLVFPAAEPRVRAERDVRAILHRLRSQRDESALSTADAVAVNKERRLRRGLLAANIALFVVGILLGVIIGAIIPFSEVIRDVKVDYNGLTVRAVLVLAAFLLPARLLAVVRVFTDERSMERELSLVRSLPTRDPKTPDNPTPCYFKAHERELLLGVRIALVGVAVVYIILGIGNGGMADVLEKAIKICTECIGLG